MSINNDLAEQSIERTIKTLRYGTHSGNEASRMVAALERELLKSVPDFGDIKSLNKINALIKELRGVIKAKYSEIEGILSKELGQLAKLESDWQAASINSIVGVDIITRTPTAAQAEAIASDAMINGAVVGEHWSRQSLDTQNRFADAIRLGMSNSETSSQISKRVSEALGISRREAFVLGKTSVQAVAMKARTSVFLDNSEVVKGKITLATLDTHTCVQCAAYDKAAYDLENKPINGTKLPYREALKHFSCRCVWSVALKSYREMGLPFDDFKPSTRASMDGQVDASMTFQTFLDKKPKAWQDEYLGKGRAELYRKGDLTLADLLSGTGRELTIDQLKH